MFALLVAVPPAVASNLRNLAHFERKPPSINFTVTVLRLNLCARFSSQTTLKYVGCTGSVWRRLLNSRSSSRTALKYETRVSSKSPIY